MAARTLIQVTRILVQPIRPLPILHSTGGSTTHNTRLVLQPALCRTFCVSQVSNAQATPSGAPPKDQQDDVHDVNSHGSIDTTIEHRLQDIKSGEFKHVDHPENLQHFRGTLLRRVTDDPEKSYSPEVSHDTSATKSGCNNETPHQSKHNNAEPTIPTNGNHQNSLKSILERKRPPTLSAENATDPTMVDKDPDSEAGPGRGRYTLPHPIWSEKEVHGIKITHKTPKGTIDRLAFYSVQALRSSYDLISGYNRNQRDEALWLKRIIFLETVAGVPGMVAAMVRHLHSLRKMRRDHGWIHTLLEEAENERMHLMTAMQLKQPTIMFRSMVMGAQGVFVSMFSLAYLFSPRYCHRFVGYLEEEAVITYSKCLKDIDNGLLRHWQTQPAPVLARRYWNLLPAATMRDVILAIRADEAHHRVVNHTLASMKPDDFNPYKPGE